MSGPASALAAGAANVAAYASSGDVSMAGVTGVTGTSPIPAVTPMAGVAGTGTGIVTVAPTTAALNAPGANTFIQFTPQELATAPSMDPALEALLRSVNLCEHLISAFRVQEITDRELFLALDTSEESLRDTCKEAFGVDPSKGFAHKRELGKIIKAYGTMRRYTVTPSSKSTRWLARTENLYLCWELTGRR